MKERNQLIEEIKLAARSLRPETISSDDLLETARLLDNLCSDIIDLPETKYSMEDDENAEYFQNWLNNEIFSLYDTDMDKSPVFKRWEIKDHCSTIKKKLSHFITQVKPSANLSDEES